MTSPCEQLAPPAWDALTPVQIDLLRRLASAGYSAVYVANRLACTAQTIERDARRLGITFASVPRA